MSDPRILLVSDSAVLATAVVRHCADISGLGAVRAGDADEATALLAGGGRQGFLLSVVDLGLPDAAVGRLAGVAATEGIPWLAVADHYTPALREKAEALDAIDFVVADAEEPEGVARYVDRLLKNRGARILVVEDSAFMRVHLRRQLRRYQFRVHMAGSPGLAMRILEQRPDITAVIIDYEMPDQNGVELTRAIRRRFRHREVCLIGISGKAPRAISAEFLKNGGDDYLHKPFEREELYCRVLHGVEAVERMLEIKRLERLRRMFLSMLAHDLKSPAGGIVGAANLILDGVCGQVGSEVREMAAVISQAGRRLCTLAANMQDLTRLETGRLEPSLVMSHLDGLIMERARLAEATASGKGIRLEADVAPLPVMAFDPDLVARLLDNLLSNAVKFSPPKSRVRVELEAAAGEAVIRVHDQGPGILPEERHRLFKPFERLSARPTAGEKSLGLGLAIAEGIVTAHGGRIWVECQPGQGAVFCFTLPIETAAQSSDCSCE
ncbi:response regulator receiver sensor signal transduction histidine kinase [Solidesulfovibrio carbinoliphilus subsp. oakridgensis]|uniref:histidine kinase n=1 Tax=Solidesulfovibrio carbinoliphilus subsp. oakridgensis TaxID=694327 RepID=G7Q7G0_9BACT|nr:hybrid sensor histidine kinase/response regulator [Solidesulfovibrio carbinoliphilus]EHJ47113.1 response regulator receiver sensor signal transduction histidine kinase [Solidesulfovibrio carbinoliphilus subsp. oakridgensis]